MSTAEERRLIVISNRLPANIIKKDDGTAVVTQGGGGLVTALAPVLRDRGGVWVGWPGSVGKDTEKLLADFSRKAGYYLHPVFLTDQEVKGFYEGFSNGILWPLFHEFQIPADYDPQYWLAYRQANAKFAQAALAVANKNDFIWVHDYQLMLLASQFKEQGEGRRTGFFLHIPFPPADIFMKLPWRKEIVDALLDFDLIGFQTVRDRVNFADVTKRLYPNATKRGRGAISSLSANGKSARVGAFPISIDYHSFASAVTQPAIRTKARELRYAIGEQRFLIFSADRLDYTKGILHRFNAVREALNRYPELRERLALVQVLVPSREGVSEYQNLKMKIERTVGELNGQFGTPGWTPVHYMYRNLSKDELIAYYLAADMAMVTSLRDGMNLVAKEFAACHMDGRGILCLSEFAGAAMEFHRHALMVNPFDIQGTAAAIHQAVNMSPDLRRRKMRRIRDIIRRNDIFRWVDSFLTAAFSRRLGDFPLWADTKWQQWEEVQGPPWNVKS